MQSKIRSLPFVVASVLSMLLVACGSENGAVIVDPEGQVVTDQSLPQSDESADVNADVDNDGTTDDPDEPEAVIIETELEAVYRATFEASWSAETHPTNFPFDPHFSSLTGLVHSSQTVLWRLGGIATLGIQEMAETGATFILSSEMDFAINEGRALATINGAGIDSSPGTTSVEFTVDNINSRVTLVSSLAPSPDWFVGVSGLKMTDQDGSFVQSHTVELALYDAGTDAGTRYESPDLRNDPRSPITLVNSFPPDTDFFDGRPFAGRLIVERIR